MGRVPGKAFEHRLSAQPHVDLQPSGRPVGQPDHGKPGRQRRREGRLPGHDRRRRAVVPAEPGRPEGAHGFRHRPGACGRRFLWSRWTCAWRCWPRPSGCWRSLWSATPPKNVVTTTNLGSQLGLQGDLLAGSGRPAEAQARYREAVKVLSGHRAVADDRLQVGLLQRSAEVAVRAGRGGEALASVTQALRVAERAAQAPRGVPAGAAAVAAGLSEPGRHSRQTPPDGGSPALAPQGPGRLCASLGGEGLSRPASQDHGSVEDRSCRRWEVTRQAVLIRDSFALVKEAPQAIVMLFYGRLFDMDPSLRALFKIDMKLQSKKLADTLAAVVDAAEQLDALVPTLRQLGRTHATQRAAGALRNRPAGPAMGAGAGAAGRL